MAQGPEILQEFARSLTGHDSKTIAAYLSAMRGLVDWLAAQPGGTPFRAELLTETVVRGYMDTLKATGRAPRTRQKTLIGIRSFCRWAISEGLLHRNPTHQIDPPPLSPRHPVS